MNSLAPEPPDPDHRGPISIVLGTFNNMSDRDVRKQKRLDARTKGLLEVSGEEAGEGQLRCRVGFLHRTVGEFLNKRDIRARFIESAGPNFSSKISLCHGFLTVTKFIPPPLDRSSGTALEVEPRLYVRNRHRLSTDGGD
jgi:hypothetical protein